MTDLTIRRALWVTARPLPKHLLADDHSRCLHCDRTDGAATTDHSFNHQRLRLFISAYGGAITTEELGSLQISVPNEVTA